MSLAYRSAALLSAALLVTAVAAHADTFAGTAAFSDSGPKGNGLNYTGTFNSPSFSFSGPVGTTYKDALTITATQLNLFDTSDNISVQLLFSLPGTASGTLSGTGDNTTEFSIFSGFYTNNSIDWTSNTILINFTNGAQLSANLPDFNFTSGLFDTTATGKENLTLTVTKTALTPEPSSLALLGTGLVGACGVLRRRFAR